MTNMSEMQDRSSTGGETVATIERAAANHPAGGHPRQLPSDPIDTLIPPPRRWWVRLAVAAGLLVAVGVIGYLWHFGHLRPNPSCCGTGSSGAVIGLAAEPDAVTVTAYLYNSSPVDVMVTGADADLPGAEVLRVDPYPDGLGWSMPPQELDELPVVTTSNHGRWFAITFRPVDCAAGPGDTGDWGTLRLQLEVPDRWYPTFGRTFTVPEPVVSGGPNDLSVLPPAALDDAVTQIDRPLAAACALLGR